MYSAFLTPQGRILSDVFFHRERGRSEGEPSTSSSSSSSPSLFAEVDASVAPQILSLLKRYRLRAQVEIDDVGEDFEVVVKGFGESCDGGGGGGGRGGGGGGGGKDTKEWPRDPRGLAALGFRTVMPSGTVSFSSSASSPRSYAATRYALGVAEGGELEPGRGTPLEANLDGLRGVSFAKGCYVGQELVARAHFRGQVHKRVMPVEVVVVSDGGAGGGGDVGGEGGKAAEKGGSPSSLTGRDIVVVSDSSPSPSASSSSSSAKPPRSAGRLLALCRESGRGLALLRLNAVQGLLLPGKEGEDAPLPKLALAPSGRGDEESGLAFSPSRPEWWPEDWGRE